MDETLIHAKLKSSVPDDWNEDFTITCKEGDGTEIVFAVKMRPCLMDCLR